jgi:hypothetical protein
MLITFGVEFTHCKSLTHKLAPDQVVGQSLLLLGTGLSSPQAHEYILALGPLK